MKIATKIVELTLTKLLGRLDKASGPRCSPMECNYAGCQERYDTLVKLFKHYRDSHPSASA